MKSVLVISSLALRIKWKSSSSSEYRLPNIMAQITLVTERPRKEIFPMKEIFLMKEIFSMKEKQHAQILCPKQQDILLFNQSQARSMCGAIVFSTGSEF